MQRTSMRLIAAVFNLLTMKVLHDGLHSTLDTILAEQNTFMLQLITMERKWVLSTSKARALKGNQSILPNHTFAGSTISHIGQVFFDTSLSNQIQTTKYYLNNTQQITTNAEDYIFLQEAAIGDPITEYSLLGSELDDGIFAWIAFGIDVSREGSISAAATYGEDGGHANANSGYPGGLGGNYTIPPGGNFTAVPTSDLAGASSTAN